MTDGALLRRWVQRRDAESFDAIVTRFSDQVYGTCRNILRNDADAEEVAQECFLHLVRSGGDVQSSLGGWLHCVATTKSLDRIRGEARRRNHEQVFSEMAPRAVEPTWDDIREHVDAAIESLPDDLREVIVAHFVGRRTHREIARELGLTRRAVSYRIQRGLEALREELGRRGVTVTVTALASIALAHAAPAAPLSLKATLGKLAIAADSNIAGAGGATTATSLAGSLILMKAKLTIAAAVLLCAAAGIYIATHPEVHDVLLDTGNEVPDASMIPAGPGGPLTEGEQESVETVSQSPPLVDVPDSEERGGVLDMYVINREAAPVVGVLVHADTHGAGGESSPRSFEGVTDSSGKCRIGGLAWGSYTVRAVDGSSAAVAQISLNESRQCAAVDLVLKPAGTIVGSVTDSAGKPIPGANVVLVNQTWGAAVAGSINSDAAGHFEFAHVPLGRYRLQVTATGYAPEQSRPVGVDESPLTIRLTAGGGLTLAVLGEQSRKPIAGMGMTLRLSAFTDLEMSAISDAQGKVLFSGLPNGRCLLRSSDSRYVLEPLEPEMEAGIGRVITGELFVRESAAVFGRVTDGETGEPVAGVTVVARNEPTRTLRWVSEPTGPDGKYELRGLAAEQCEVVIESPPRPYSALYEENRVFFALAPGEEKRGVDFELYQGTGVEGVVVDVAGLPVVGASVRLHAYRNGSEKPSHASRDITDASGHFYIGGLNLLNVRIGADGVITDSEDERLNEISLQAEFRGATSADTGRMMLPASGIEGIVLSLREQDGGSISGHVVDERGVPTVARVLYSRMDGLGTPGKSGVFSDVDGFFLFSGVPAGAYTLSVAPYSRSGQGGSSVEVLELQVAAGQAVRNLRLTLPGGLEIRGRLVDSKGNPVKHCMVTATQLADLSNPMEAFTDENGDFVFGDVESGDYMLGFGIGYGPQENPAIPPQIVTAGDEVEIVWEAP